MSNRFDLINQKYPGSFPPEWLITRGGKDISKPIDHDSESVLAAFIEKYSEFDPNPLKIEQLLSESVTLVERCLANRRRAHLLQDTVFQLVLRHARFKKLDGLLEKDVEVGLYTKPINNISRTKEQMKLAKETYASIQTGENHSSLTATARSIEAGLSADNAAENESLEVDLKKNQLKRNEIVREFEKFQRKGSFPEDDESGIINRFDPIKESFDLDLANAYFRLKSVVVGLKHLFGAEEQFGLAYADSLSRFPAVDSTNLLSELHLWLREILSTLRMVLSEDQDIEFIVNPAFDGKKRTGEPWALEDFDENHAIFRIPDSVFKRWKNRRLKAFALQHEMDDASFRVLVYPPGQEISGKTYGGVPIQVIAKNHKIGGDQYYRGEFTNIDPAGEWQLVVGRPSHIENDDVIEGTKRANSGNWTLKFLISALPLRDDVS